MLKLLLYNIYNPSIYTLLLSSKFPIYAYNGLYDYIWRKFIIITFFYDKIPYKKLFFSILYNCPSNAHTSVLIDKIINNAIYIFSINNKLQSISYKINIISDAKIAIFFFFFYHLLYIPFNFSPIFIAVWLERNERRGQVTNEWAYIKIKPETKKLKRHNADTYRRP